MKKIMYCLPILIGILLLCGCDKSGSYEEISYDELKEKMENKESLILEVMSTSCTHCAAMEDIYKEVAKKEKITIYYLNTKNLTKEEANEFKKEINISGTPTIVFIKKGKEEQTLYRVVGEVTKEKLTEKIRLAGFIK